MEASEARTAAKVQPQGEEAPEKGGNGSRANSGLRVKSGCKLVLSVPEDSHHSSFSFLTREPKPSLSFNKIISSRL